jgi:hypothetical protein
LASDGCFTPPPSNRMRCIRLLAPSRKGRGYFFSRTFPVARHYFDVRPMRMLMVFP